MTEALKQLPFITSNFLMLLFVDDGQGCCFTIHATSFLRRQLMHSRADPLMEPRQFSADIECH